ncbi:MAG: EamA family transporter [Deinococcales bacterium]
MVAGRRLLRSTPAPALEIAAIVSIHLGAALATRLFDAWGEQGTAFVRLALGACVLLALARPRPSNLSGADWRRLLLFGAVLAGLNLFFYEALARLPLGVVATIEFAGPLTVALAGTRRVLDLLWVLLAAAGILLLAPIGGAPLDPVGLAFAAAAATCLGLYIVVGGRLGRSIPGLQGLALAMAVAAVLLLPVGTLRAGASLLRPGLLALGLAVALISTIVPFSLEFEAMRRMRPRAFGVLLSSEPGIAALVGIVFLGDVLGLRQILALGAITVASVGSTLRERTG